MPQNGHGMPVAARSGHAIGGCTGQERPRARRPRPCAPLATRSSRRAHRRAAGSRRHDTRAVTCGPAWRRRCLRARTRDGCSGAPATFGPSAAASSSAKYDAGRAREREAAVEELAHRREFARIERRDVPGCDRVDGHRDRRGGAGRDPGEAVAGDDRARREVAEPLVVFGRDDRDRRRRGRRPGRKSTMRTMLRIALGEEADRFALRRRPGSRPPACRWCGRCSASRTATS